MVVCTMPGCQSTAGCQCNRGVSWHPISVPVTGLDQFTDEQIAREHYWRQMKKLGDPRIGVCGYISSPTT